jgi:hypothetical protein
MLNAQNLDFGNFPSENNDEKPILTSDLLKSLNWEKLKEFSNSNEGHYTYKRKDSLLVEYEYVQQGRVADFEIISFKGKVLEYQCQISNSTKETNTNYFDKKLWLEYAHTYLPNLADSLKLSINEPKRILKAYYELLGVGTYDEYGWICEYSTVGRATDQRMAVIELLGREELLWQLLEYPNVHVQLYVADALIYSDFRDKQMIEEYKENRKYKTAREMIKYLKDELLTKAEWKKIYELRDSNQKVSTCKSGTGSFKIYENNTSELLNEQAISEIPKRYEELRKLGYLR